VKQVQNETNKNNIDTNVELLIVPMARDIVSDSKEPGFIPKDEYIEIIKKTQIISTDFVIFNHQGQVLLGLRNNEPAKDTWFVPGGKVRINEKIHDAVKRITKQELGTELPASQDLGVYHHVYSNNFANDEHGTHYIVFAVTITLDEDIGLTRDDQHRSLKWWDVEKLVADPNVHALTKNYFHPAPWNKAFF
jgi:colanic acid biosynthesis protein WcaH